MRLHLVVILPDHPLEARDGVGNVLGHLRQGGLPDQDFAVREGYHCGSGPQAMVVRDDLWSSLVPHTDIAVRAAEIYTNSDRHSNYSRLATAETTAVLLGQSSQGGAQFELRHMFGGGAKNEEIFFQRIEGSSIHFAHPTQTLPRSLGIAREI